MKKKNALMTIIFRKNNRDKKNSQNYLFQMFFCLRHFCINVENTIMINHLSSTKYVKIFKNKKLKRISKTLEF